MLRTNCSSATQVAWLLKQANAQPLGAPIAWDFLEAAHIVGQSQFRLHILMHMHMFVRAWRERRGSEVRAQVFRLVLTPFGHLFQRLPLGNPGSGRVGAFKASNVPPHLQVLIDQSFLIAEKEPAT